MYVHTSSQIDFPNQLTTFFSHCHPLVTRSVYKERKSLRRSLNDSETTVSKLNVLLSVILVFFLVFVYLALFRVQLEKFLVLYSGIVGVCC